jgi:Putative papain-like cysteine peptidase (DUF1796)
MDAMLGGECPRSERGGYGGVKVPAPLPPDQLLRIESLGDNCEPGFVLRKLGCEAGSLFRWARVTPDQLLAVLRADFEGIYEFAGLTPLYLDMVKDKRYGIGWHTEMRSAVADDGRWRFVGDDTVRQKIYRQEIEKIRYLASKFISHTQLGGIIFVLKCNAGIATDVLYAILASLARIAAGNRFALLEIRASDDPAQIGTVTQERPDLLRGYISRFAPYEHADDIDMAAWTKILAQAFQLFPCPDWPARLARRAGAESKIELPFRSTRASISPDRFSAICAAAPQSCSMATCGAGRSMAHSGSMAASLTRPAPSCAGSASMRRTRHSSARHSNARSMIRNGSTSPQRFATKTGKIWPNGAAPSRRKSLRISRSISRRCRSGRSASS